MNGVHGRTGEGSTEGGARRELGLDVEGRGFRQGTGASGDRRAGAGCAGYGDDGGSPDVRGRRGWSHAVQVDGVVLHEDLVAPGVRVQRVRNTAAPPKRAGWGVGLRDFGHWGFRVQDSLQALSGPVRSGDRHDSNASGLGVYRFP